MVEVGSPPQPLIYHADTRLTMSLQIYRVYQPCLISRNVFTTPYSKGCFPPSAPTPSRCHCRSCWNARSRRVISSLPLLPPWTSLSPAAFEGWRFFFPSQFVGFFKITFLKVNSMETIFSDCLCYCCRCTLNEFAVIFFLSLVFLFWKIFPPKEKFKKFHKSIIRY